MSEFLVASHFDAVADPFAPVVDRDFLAMVPLTSLLLDPGNELDAVEGAPADASVEVLRAVVPMTARQRLCRQPLDGLASSIVLHPRSLDGRILVRPTVDGPDGSPRYIVIDGAWHLAALWLLNNVHEDDPNVPIPAVVDELTKRCPVRVVGEETDPAMILALLEDVSPPDSDDWFSGQRRRLLRGLSRGQTMGRPPVGVQPTERVVRRVWAYQALRQMMAEHGMAVGTADHVGHLVHDIVGRVSLRQWLGMDEQNNRFSNDDAVASLTRLLTPASDAPAIIATVTDVASLCDLTRTPEVFARFVTFDDAAGEIAVVTAETELDGSLASIGQAIESLKWDKRRFEYSA